ncbi:MAG: SPOR domain-containing protein [Phycisphaerae bacterium]|nr:SPOR domain-containing protein [Gemmatimonadaceae bacterium]
MNCFSRLFGALSTRPVVALLLAVSIAPTVQAQGTATSGAASTARGASAAVNTVVQRARVLADAGDGTKARGLLDSLVNELPRQSNDAAEALYWRALLSDDTAPAELDWKRIVVESPFSPRASEALLRLSEINLLRNNQAVARQNVQQLLVDHPDAPERPRALLVLARSYFDERDAPRACGVLTAVRKEAPLGAVEVRLQADEMQQQCRGVREVALGAESDATTVVATAAGTTGGGALAAQTAVLPPATATRPPATATRTPAAAANNADSVRRAAADVASSTESARIEAARIESARIESARKDSVARAATSRRDSAARVAVTRRDSIALAAATRRDSITHATIMRADSVTRIATARADSMRAVIARDSVLRDSLRRVYAARDSAAGITTTRDRARRDSATRVANTVDSLANVVRGTPPANPGPAATGAAAKAGRFTVQIAAYKTRAQANTLVRKLNANNMNAFVAGTKQRFRVNIGRYTTRAQANEALAALKKKGQNGLVVEVPA